MSEANSPELAFDVIGDIHGQRDVLERLGRDLGYRTDADWTHAEGRRLVFIGDLIDRGPASLEVAELVRRLCLDGSAICLLGNHELNLVEWRHGRAHAKAANRETIEDIRARPGRWDPILDFFESLPLALEFDDLRVTHAVWHLGAFAELHGALAEPGSGPHVDDHWRPHVALHAPFEKGAHRLGLATDAFDDQSEPALDVFLKGHESPAPTAFIDNDGRSRDMTRTEWWRPNHDGVPRDKRIVFGHYWNMPPITGVHDAFVPPFPSGHPDLQRWIKENEGAVASRGRALVPPSVGAVCIDYNGVTQTGVVGLVSARIGILRPRSHGRLELRARASVRSDHLFAEDTNP